MSVDRQRIEDLVSRHLDGLLSTEERTELIQEVESDPDAARLMAATLRMHSCLVSKLNPEANIEHLPARILRHVYHGGQAGARKAGVLRTTKHTQSRPSMNTVGPRWGRWAFVTACLVIVVGSLAYNHYQSQRFGEVLIAHIRETVPGITVYRGEKGIIAVVNMPIFHGDRISTKKGQNVTFTYENEHTEVKLDENTSLDIGGAGKGKRLHLDTGEIDVIVAPQPQNAPMEVTTAHAKAEIRGTSFSLATTSRETRIKVTKGQVRFERLSDGESVDVAGGQYAVAADGVDLAALPAAPASQGESGEILYGLIPVNKELADRFLAFEWPEDYSLRGITFGDGSLWVCWRWKGKKPEMLWRVDPESGRILDRVEIKTSISANLAWERGRIWALTWGEMRLIALDPTTGEVAVRTDARKGALRREPYSLDVAGGSAWVCRERQLVKVDIASGNVLLWKKLPGVPGAIAAEGDVVYCCVSSCLMKLDARDGRILASYPYTRGKMVPADLAIDGSGRIWAISYDSRYLMIMKTGE